jgi:cardiolipin synthase
VVAFEGARGPVSDSRSAAIIDKLEGTSGDSDILQKHLAMEQAVNADSPLGLGNKRVLAAGRPGPCQAMFARDLVRPL